jgi:hypothetical protein
MVLVVVAAVCGLLAMVAVFVVIHNLPVNNH